MLNSDDNRATNSVNIDLLSIIIAIKFLLSWIAIYHFYGKSIVQNIKHFLAWNHSEKDFLILSWVIIKIVFLYLLKNKYIESLALFWIWNIPFYIVKPFDHFHFCGKVSA